MILYYGFCLLVLIAFGFFLLVWMGNLTAMKFLAKNGVAVFSRNMDTDFKLLNYVNKEGIGWLKMNHICYSPVMFSDKYKDKNFLQKQSRYGELYVDTYKTDKLAHLRLESDSTIKDLTIIEGKSEGMSEDLRKANFSMLRKAGDLIGEKSILFRTLDGVSKYEVLCVVEKDITENFKINSTSRNNLIKGLLEESKVKNETLKYSNRDALILECNTEVDIVIAVLLKCK